MKGKDYLIFVAGAALLCAGWYLLNIVDDPHGMMRTLPYVFLGSGCGIFGYSLSRIFTRCLMKKYPETVRQMEIEVKDERNAAIASRAKAKAFDLMIFVFGILMVIFALINIRMEAIGDLNTKERCSAGGERKIFRVRNVLQRSALLWGKSGIRRDKGKENMIRKFRERRNKWHRQRNL